MTKAKKVAYLFWITSSRGTDEKRVFLLPASYSKDDISSVLEEWCSHFGAWNVSENVCQYGFKRVAIPPRKELLIKYKRACDLKNKAIARWAVLVAMLNPQDR